MNPGERAHWRTIGFEVDGSRVTGNPEVIFK